MLHLLPQQVYRETLQAGIAPFGGFLHLNNAHSNHLQLKSCLERLIVDDGRFERAWVFYGQELLPMQHHSVSCN